MEREGEVAERDDDAANEDAAVLAQPAVGDEATDDRREPDARDVVAVGEAGMLLSSCTG